MGESLVGWCGTCGPVEVSPALSELHRDPRTGFALHAFVCTGCGELTVGRCPELATQLRALGVPERRLSCTSPPAGASGASTPHR